MALQLPPLAPQPRRTVYLGTIIQCNDTTKELEIWHNAAVFVDEKGKIVRIDRPRLKDSGDSGISGHEGDDWSYEMLEGVVKEVGWMGENLNVVRTGKGEFWFPGFIDTHIHASQYANAGIFGKSTLLDWLETYTFPMESSLTNLAKARSVYSTCVTRTLQNGTTTASYFATIDVAATNLLADICLATGQRAFIGRVCMDTLSPDYYRDESVEKCISRTKACIAHIQSRDPGYEKICPIITPRFAPSCTSEMLSALGTLRAETNLPVQTHISENKAEIALVKELFPGYESYTDVYYKHNLLTPRTILAHAVHLSQEELEVIKARESKISHCPASNSAITSGTARIRWMLDNGVDVGLGTDMSGGYSPSILEAVRQALLVSRHVAMGIPDGAEKEMAKLTVEECLWLATRGGARVVGLADKIGGFEVGKEWDAQLIGLKLVASDSAGEGLGEGKWEDGGPVDIFGWESWSERVEKWVFGGDDRNTKAVWVGGRLVHSKKAGLVVR